MRRMLLVLTVAALMALMMVAMAMPAFADKKPRNFGQGHKDINQGEYGPFVDNSGFNQQANPPKSNQGDGGNPTACGNNN